MFSYKAVLFDFDGLLVDTEPLHHRAYMHLAKEIGCPLDWDFAQFCKFAHAQDNGFFVGLEQEYPDVFAKGHSKKSLYERKKQLYEGLLQTEGLCLMPGVEQALCFLQDQQTPRAVVTNSPRRQIEVVQNKLPLLKSIPLWITREDYQQSKPSAEGYLLALSKLGVSPQEAVGFEDSIKGIQSLASAGVHPVFVCSRHTPAIAQSKSLGASHVVSLSDFFDK